MRRFLASRSIITCLSLRERNPEADETHGNAGRGTRDGHEEFSIRVAGLLLHLGHAAQREQRDAANTEPARLRHQRVRQLVRDQPCEEQ